MSDVRTVLTLNRVEENVNSLLRSWFDTGEQRYLDDCRELEVEYKKRTGRPCPIWRATLLHMTGQGGWK
jgi:hypothetical protein